MAKRYSGNATVQVTYHDGDSIYRDGSYKVTISIPRERGANKPVWSAIIGPPGIGFGPGVAYDSPTVYDAVARTSLSSASCEVEEVVIEPGVNDEIMVSRKPLR